MAGTNKIIKKEQILFKEGDASDGMYLIRKGAILVYLDKGEGEVKLATLKAGAMLGEMALFDKKPRSASAKAIEDSEVTKISNSDFSKLMKQIPKWFVSLMSTLSSRLRETNDRLQNLQTKVNENDGQGLACDIKILNILALLWAKDGHKEGKKWNLERNTSEEEIARILDIDKDGINRTLEGIIKGKLVTVTRGSYNNDIMAIPTKGHLNKFIDFVIKFKEEHPCEQSLPDDAMQMLEVILKLVEESIYETVTLSLGDIFEKASEMSFTTDTWKDSLAYFKKTHNEISLVKVSDGLGVRVDKNTFPSFLEYHKVLHAMHREKTHKETLSLY